MVSDFLKRNDVRADFFSRDLRGGILIEMYIDSAAGVALREELDKLAGEIVDHIVIEDRFFMMMTVVPSFAPGWRSSAEWIEANALGEVKEEKDSDMRYSMIVKMPCAAIASSLRICDHYGMGPSAMYNEEESFSETNKKWNGADWAVNLEYTDNHDYLSLSLRDKKLGHRLVALFQRYIGNAQEVLKL